MRKLLIALVGVLALGQPASAIHRYQYLWDSGNPTQDCSGSGSGYGCVTTIPPGSLTRFTVSWESDALMALQSTAIGDSCPPFAESMPDFSTSALTPGYKFDELSFCLVVGFGYVSILTTAPDGTVMQSFDSPKSGPFPAPGVYQLYFFAGDGQGGSLTFPDTKLYISDRFAGPPPPPVLFCPNCTIKVSLVEGPIIPLPGTPVEAQVGLTTLSGVPVGNPQSVTLVGGRITTVQFDSSIILSASANANGFSTDTDVIPVVTVINANASTPPLQITTEVSDNRTGFGQVLASSSPPARAFVPQELAAGQVMRLIATAPSPTPCIARLGFTDASGAPVGPTVSVALAQGHSKSLDLNATTLSLRSRHSVLVLPVAQLPLVAPSAPGFTEVGTPSICSVTSEVFDARTGHTSTYQNAFFEERRVFAGPHSPNSR